MNHVDVVPGRLYIISDGPHEGLFITLGPSRKDGSAWIWVLRAKSCGAVIDRRPFYDLEDRSYVA
jgi:hypothetical protein